MIKDRKTNRWIILALSSASLVIWTVIIYQIIRGISYEPDPSSSLPMAVRDSVQTDYPSGYHDSLFTRLAGLRDPFKRRAEVLATKKPEAKADNPVPINRPSIDIRYVGYLSDPTGRLAVLEFSEGETVIGREGQFMEKIHLKKINREEIIIEENGIVFYLPIQP